MKENYDVEYRSLSQKGQEFMRSGNLLGYAAVLKQMSHILLAEEKRTDQIKVLMLAFYLELNIIGISQYIDDGSVGKMREALTATRMDIYNFRELYLDTIRADTVPFKHFTASDSLYLLELILTGRKSDAEEILSRIDP